MKYIIMCGGKYDKFSTPRQFIRIKNERLIERTVRLLKKAGAEDICISSNLDDFNYLGLPILRNEKNDWELQGSKTVKGYWLDAFYPVDCACTYIYGDVYYSEDCMNKIVSFAESGSSKNVLFGSWVAANTEHKNWGEPFAYVVNDMKTFRDGIDAVKKMQDEGKIKRTAITWELYRYLNGLDVNIQHVLEGDTFISIYDYTNDIDGESDIPKLLKAIEKQSAKRNPS